MGGKGQRQRGGARIIYLLLAAPSVIYFFYAYAKGDMADLNAEQKARLRRAVEAIKAEFDR
jgi:hypothetical protein